MRRVIVSAVIIAALAIAFLGLGESATAATPAHQDAYQADGGWPGYSDTDSVCYVGNINGRPTSCGWRFTGLAIPAGARITDARLSVGQSGWGYVFTSRFRFQNAQVPAALSNGFPSRTQTAWSTSWQWTKSTPGAAITSPNLAGGLQELVDRYGAIDTVVLIESPDPATPTGHSHAWASIDGGVPPTLTVTWEGGSDAQSNPPAPTPTGTPTPAPTAAPHPASDGDTLNVLWIGNSYSAYNGGVHNVFEKIAAEQGVSVNSTTHYIGGATLQTHIDNGVRTLIQQGDWDYVVLQGLWWAYSASDSEQWYRQRVSLLDGDIDAVGAQTVLVSTWTWQRGADPNYAPNGGTVSATQGEVNAINATVGAEVGAIVVPVGQDWTATLAAAPGLELYDADNTHPGPAGTYIYGKVMAGTLLDP